MPSRAETASKTGARSLAAFLLLAATAPALAAAPSLPRLPASAAYGDYAVGTATGFAVDNQLRFDPWNSRYAGPEYRAMLRQVEAAGQTRTVTFALWYPAEPAPGQGRLAGPRSPFPAASGRRANYWDLYFRAGDLRRQIGAGTQIILPQFLRLQDGGVLADADAETQQAILEEMGEKILDAERGAWQGARPAQGTFPVIILAHGLGDDYGAWGSFGEFLASHGYVAVAPTFISDGGLPLVFHDEDSPYAKQAAPAELQNTYELILGNVKVLPYFYRMMWGQESRGFGPPENFDAATAKLRPGGAARSTAMMRNLFRQRVADVGALLRTVRLLGAETGTCRRVLASLGAVSAARDLCGLLAGRVDGERVAVAGHSLGSMTAQLAVEHIPGLRTALGFNMGAPLSWTPPEMIGAGQTPEGLPVGNRKPVLLMIGDEDAVMQDFFSKMFQSELARAGGDPAQVFPLAPERAAPERETNPQPVALSAWRRAVAERVLVTVRDADHFILVQDLGRLFPWPQFQRGELPYAPGPARRRKPEGQRAFELPPTPGAAYAQLGWIEIAGAGEVYLPHVARDWHARAWFDWHLKEDPEARRRLRNPDPFGAMTFVRRAFP